MPCAFALALCLAFPLALAACGGGGTPTAPPAPEAEAPEAEAPKAEAPLITIITSSSERILIRYDGSESDRIPAPADLSLDNFVIAAGHSAYTNDIDLTVAPSQYENWGDSLPDWNGIDMVHGTGCGPCAPRAITQTNTMDAGYLKYSSFFLFAHEFRDTEPGESLERYGSSARSDEDFVAAAEMFAYSLGEPTAYNPSFNATWKGGMIGKQERYYRAAGNLLTGDASVSVALSGNGDANVSVSFTNIVDSVTDADYGGLSWTNLPLENGIFSYERKSAEDMTGDIYGSFYGPGHQEVGGVFEGILYDTLGGIITGAFGGVR